MPPLTVMMKPSSGQCNMHCDYCFYCDEMENRSQKTFGFMSEETLRNVIRKTMPHATHQITYAFQGGEPTLRGIEFFREAIRLEQQYNQNHLQVHNVLQTNGLRLNAQWCQFFKENNFLIGVSVDGNEALHDCYRHQINGASTYARIVENIALLDRFDVPYNILTVVTERLAHHAKEVYESYKQKGWHYQQYIECLDPLNSGETSSVYSLQPRSYGLFLSELFDLWYADLQRGTQPYIRQFENYISILMGIPPEACSQRGTCGMQLVVEADGSVYPCDFYMLDEYLLGNFNRDRLPQINQKREEIAFISRSTNITETCRHCQYHSICGGGCQRCRNFLPEQNAYHNRFCEAYKIFFDHCLPRMIEISATLRR